MTARANWSPSPYSSYSPSLLNSLTSFEVLVWKKGPWTACFGSVSPFHLFQRKRINKDLKFWRAGCSLWRAGNREYWMICREPGFLGVVWFGSCHTLFPTLSSQLSSTWDTQEDWERERTCWRARGEGVGEEQNHTTARSRLNAEGALLKMRWPLPSVLVSLSFLPAWIRMLSLFARTLVPVWDTCLFVWGGGGEGGGGWVLLSTYISTYVDKCTMISLT